MKAIDANTASGSAPKVPPEETFAKDLNAISIVPFLEGNGGKRKKVGLNQGTKRLLSRVIALSQKDPCYASDEYLARWLGASVPSVKRWIKEGAGYGILDVKQSGGHRRLSINGKKLGELKDEYLKFLATEEARRNGENADRHRTAADQVDHPVKMAPDQVDHDGDQVDQGEHQPDHGGDQPDTLIDNMDESSGNRVASDENNNAIAAEAAPSPLSLLSSRMAALGEQEESTKADLAECRERLEALEEGLCSKGIDPSRFAEDRAYSEASERHKHLTLSLGDVQTEIHCLIEEIEQENERLRLEVEKARAEAERLKVEAELDSWRRDPEHSILTDPAILLGAFQSACQHRFPGAPLMFPKRDNQVQQASEVLILLKDEGQLDEVVLRSWLLWYPRKCLNDQSPAHHITIRWLLESWRRFKKEWPVPTGLSRRDLKAKVLDLRRATGPVASGQAAADPAAGNPGLPV